MPRRGPLSAAQKAAIREGLRRYYMSRGQRGAKTVGIRAAARAHGQVREAERAQARTSTSPRGQREARVTRTDRAVRAVGTLADLRAGQFRDPSPRPPAGGGRPPSGQGRPGPAGRRTPQRRQPQGGGSGRPQGGAGSRQPQRRAQPAQRHPATPEQRFLNRLNTEEGRARAERQGLIRRTEDGGYEPTERGRQAMRGFTPPRNTQRRRTPPRPS